MVVQSEDTWKKRIGVHDTCKLAHFDHNVFNYEHEMLHKKTGEVDHLLSLTLSK